MDFETWELAHRKGLGRALQHVGDVSPITLRPVLLHACLHNLAYDRQLENRARWMSELVLRSGDRDWYVPGLLEGVEALTDDYDVDQALLTLAFLVKAGNEGLRAPVRAAFDSQQAAGRIELGTGRAALILMDGADALLPIARVAGKRLLADPDAWEDPYFFVPFDDVLDEPQVRERLGVAARDDARIAELLRRIDETERRRRAHRGPDAPTRAEIEALVADTSRQDDLRLVPLHAKGRLLRDEDADWFLRRLDVETDDARLERLLWLLKAPPKPRSSGRVLELARSADHRVQRAALTLLARSRDPSGPGLARELLRRDASVALRGALFEIGRGCTEADVPLILWTLDSLSSVLTKPDSVQLVVNALLEVREAAVGPAAAEVLVWVYENGYCGHCRAEVVADLVGKAALDDVRREECRFDASDDVRAAVR